MDAATATQLHRDSIVIDTHCDTLMPVLAGRRSLGERSTDGHVDLPRLIEGGVTAQTFAIYHAWRNLKHRATREALRSVDAFYRGIEANAAQLLQATQTTHIKQAKQEGRVAAILSIEGAEPLSGDTGVLRVFHRLGVRMISLTWNYRNSAADGLGITYGQRGLSETGVALVREMNRLGIVVDISHLAPPGVEDVLRITEAPIIASHVGAQSVCNHPRNLTDAQLEGVARTGGVACITLVPPFLVEDGTGATLTDYVDHMEHCIRIAGIDHVGLGSDFDGYGGVTTGMEDTSCWPAVTQELAARGYSGNDIQKVLGLNLMRVFGQVMG